VNNTHIGVEMCESGSLKYTHGATFECSNPEEAKTMAKRTFDAAVELFAYLCKKYRLDPLEDGVIISHKEGHDRGVASGHVDPEHLWTQLNLPLSMDVFRKAVKAKLDSGDVYCDEYPTKLQAKDLKKVFALSLPIKRRDSAVATPHTPAAAASRSLPPKNMPKPMPIRNAEK
jgi:hypothetical protein